jgi:hypothetical protein
MSELLPEDEALLRSARLGLDPTSEDQARIKRALFAQLGVGASGAALSGSKATSIAASAKASSSIALGTKWLAALLFVGGVVGTGIIVVRKSHHASTAISSAPSPVSSSQNASATPNAIPTATTTAPSTASDFEIGDTPPVASAITARAPNAVNSGISRAAQKSSASASATPTSSGPSTVSAEAQLLRDADAALRSGDPALALSVLDQHDASFPHGVLNEECEAERVLALCALGKISDAKKIAATFLRDHAGSPLAGRVQSSCIVQ